ncbi:MAG: hypothetical protein WEE89_14080 [Gemmatimonadota bacterium]
MRKNQVSTNFETGFETMRSFDRREVSYAQARAELTRTMAESSELPDQDRDERLARVVRGLQDKYPDLDDQMTRRLLGDGMHRRRYDLQDPI